MWLTQRQRCTRSLAFFSCCAMCGDVRAPPSRRGQGSVCEVCIVLCAGVTDAAHICICSLIYFWSKSSELLAKHELGKLLEEKMTDEERLDLQVAEEVARRFLEWDLTSDEAVYQTGVKARLAEVLGRDADG